jgi:hypothetical protein
VACSSLAPREFRRADGWLAVPVVGYIFLGSTARAAARVRFWVDAVGVVASAAAPGSEFEC